MIFDKFDFDDGEFYNLVVDPYWERDKENEYDPEIKINSDFLFNKTFEVEDDYQDDLGYELIDYDLEKPKKLTKRKGGFDER